MQELINELYTGGKNVTFKENKIEVATKEGDSIGLETLSSGEKHMLRILIETIFADEHTIFIDEPELSLHIDWQKQLLQTMRSLNPNAQIVVATHSPEIMSEVPNDNIFKL